MRLRVSLLLAGAALAASGCGGSNTPRHRMGDGDPTAFKLVQVGSFDRPVQAVAIPGTELVAIVEQGGRVRVVDGMLCRASRACPSKPINQGRTVIDIHDRVSSGSEQGLLGLALHPKWPDDPRVYIDYTDPAGDTRIEEWSWSKPTTTAHRSRELVHIDQPYSNHNGGNLVFGPDDLLYAGTGDGGDAGDPQQRAQDPTSLLGKMLRIDVDVAGTVRPEVWGVGLRNPWRYAFDRATGDLWIGDVGQDAYEEIDALRRSQLSDGTRPNFGWSIREGFEPFRPRAARGPGTIFDPVVQYGHGDGCSVTGGVVYRGSAIPDLVGWYVFTDLCVRTLYLLDGSGIAGTRRAADELSWKSAPGGEQVVSINETTDGELLIVSTAGSILQAVPA